MNEPLLQLDCIQKSYYVDGTDHQVIRNLSFSLADKAFICILGFTGCGKTTLLRMICGFEQPSGGTIKIMGQVLDKPSKDVMMVFQDSNQLFPWKTALENVAFVIRNTRRGIGRKASRLEAKALLNEVGLAEYEKYYPHQLSGGMRQRITVARTLAAQPRIMLMDEPFSALDELTRQKIQTLCRNIYEERDLSVLFVTHSIEESLTLADQIVIMGQNDGSVVAVLENLCRKDKSKAIRDTMRNIIMDYLQSNQFEKGEKNEIH